MPKTRESNNLDLVPIDTGASQPSEAPDFEPGLPVKCSFILSDLGLHFSHEKISLNTYIPHVN